MNGLRLRALVSGVLMAAASAFAQPVDPNQPDMTIDAAVREQVIAGSLTALERSYIFPDVAAKVGEDIRKRDAAAQQMQATSRDRHLRVVYSHDVLPEGGPRPVSETEHAQLAAKRR